MFQGKENGRGVGGHASSGECRSPSAPRSPHLFSGQWRRLLFLPASPNSPGIGRGRVTGTSCFALGHEGPNNNYRPNVGLCSIPTPGKEEESKFRVAGVGIPCGRDVRMEETHRVMKNPESRKHTPAKGPRCKKKQESCQRTPEATIRVGCRVQSLRPQDQEQGEGAGGPRHGLECHSFEFAFSSLRGHGVCMDHT